MKSRHAPWSWLLAASMALTTLPGTAQPADAKAQAKELYGLGNERFDRGDFQGAAQAYRQAYELYENPVILFNLALAYDGDDKPVETVEVLERLLAAPGKLKPTFVERAKKALADNAKVVAELQVSCNVEGATIAVDGETIGSFPLSKPVKVASGRVILQATKKGYQAGYQAVSASGGQVLPVTIELVEAAKPPAQLKIRTNLPGAEVWIDGYLVATTPLRSTLPVTPGEAHRVEVRRDGYVTASETLTLGQGAMSELVLEPKPDPQAIQQGGGTLELDLAQPDASVFVNGTRREIADGGSLRLAAGPHVITAEREGYVPLRLEVDVPSGGTTSSTLDLIPTPETRARMIGDAELDQGLGWGLTVTGPVLMGVGAGLLGWSLGERADAAASAQAFDDRAGAYSQPPYSRCALDSDSVALDNFGIPSFGDFCRSHDARLNSRRNDMTTIAIASGVGIGLGAVSLVTGIVFLATGEDPDQFRLRVDDDVFALELRPAIDGGPRRGFVGVRARF